MFSYVLSSATSYFHLPIDDDIDLDTKHIAWSSDSTHSDDDDDSPPSSSTSPSTSATHAQNRKKAVIHEILAQSDLYRILGIQRAAYIDKLTLRRAYLSRSKACHPDKFPDNPEATRAFQKLAVAYDVLSKPSSKRLYDARPPQSAYDLFASRPYPPPEETFRSVVTGVFNDILDGDLDMIRTLLRAVNDMNPSLRLGEEGIDSVLLTLQAIRERALTCRACIFALHTELTRLLEVQRAFRALSYFDLRRRSCLAVRLARLTLALPIALDRALVRQRADDDDDDDDDVYGHDRMRTREDSALLNRRIYALLRGVVLVLERMEHILM